MSKLFRSFTCDRFAKVRCSGGQRTEGHFRYPGASNAIAIIVDLRSEHDLKVLLKVGHADSATNMQVIGLTHQPTGFNGRLFDVTCVYRKLKLGRSGDGVRQGWRVN